MKGQTQKRLSAQNRLNRVFQEVRTGFIALMFFSLFINALMLTAPLYMMQVFDRVLPSRSGETLMVLMGIALTALITLALLDSIRSFILVRLSVWIDRRLSGVVLSGSIIRTLGRKQDMSNQGLRDLATVRSFLTGPGIGPAMDAPWAPILLGVMFFLHPLLGWLALVGGALLFSLGVLNEMSTHETLNKASQASMAALDQASAAIRNADVVEAMGMLPQVIQRWERHNHRAVGLQAQASYRSGVIVAFSKFVRFCLQIGILSAGAWLVVQDKLSPGAMIASSILMGRALAPVEQAISFWKSMTSARNAYQRMQNLLKQTPIRGGGMPLPEPRGILDVEGLTYVHPGSKEPVIRGVRFSLQPGDIMGLIGRSASGKSTLARLLIGNLIPQAGHVRLDGMNLAFWDPEDRGQYVGYMPQDVELFSGTVGENIARLGSVDPERVVSAARFASVHDLILHLPNGYETEIGEGGIALSGGQRQRIALARTVYDRPRFVVLDEPNASLDHEGEMALVRTLQLLKKNRVTTIVISHRPSLIRYMDHILVLNHGRVQMFGKREEVLPHVTDQLPGKGKQAIQKKRFKRIPNKKPAKDV
ncbi:type I secretion system permease/ATPase [Magnetococcales bacterium HHB-1]